MKKLSVLIFLFAGFGAMAQNQIGLNDVIANTLKNNLNVKIAENNASLAENNATRGNAGALPTVTAGAGVNGSLTNTKLVFAGNAQPPLERDGAQSITTSGNVTANYVLFNGFTASNTYTQLELQSELANAQSQVQIEGILIQSINAFFGALQLQSNLRAAEKSLTISVERYERARLRKEYGSANSIAMLNAAVDMKNDSITVINISQQLNNAKSQLAYLMGIESNEFDLIEEFEVESNIDRNELNETAKAQNLSVLAARKSLEISEKGIDISQGSYYPKLSISTGYSMSNNQSDASFLSENRSNGFNGGLTLSYNLFNGGKSAIARENAKINWETSKLKVDDLNKSLETQIDMAFATYQNNLNVVQLRESTLKVSAQNFERTQELFKIGQASGTDFREAQLNLLNAEILLYLSKVSAKLSEYELLRLSGQLVSMN